jgi:hypothetical protein
MQAPSTADQAVCAITGNTGKPAYGTYAIFEDTSEIQRLIIARAISGIHVQ